MRCGEGVLKGHRQYSYQVRIKGARDEILEILRYEEVPRGQGAITTPAIAMVMHDHASESK